MNKRILLAWEIGSGRGHAYILAWIAGALKRRGYEPILAVQRLDSLQSVEAGLAGVDCLQVPVWPGTIDPGAHRAAGPIVTLGDIVADLGLRVPSITRRMILAWDRLLAFVQPAVLIADYAPGALLAARGRVPTIAVGEGFTLPPTTMKRFPLLKADAGQAKYDEDVLLEAVNDSLRDTQRATLSRLPEIFAADRSCVAAFTELDPYAQHRTQPNAGPWAPAWSRAAAKEERYLFCYFSARTSFDTVLVKALQEVTRNGVPVRVHMPQLNEGQRSLLVEIGMTVEQRPLPFEEIHRTARLVVSHGSFSFVSCALVSGIPQIIFPTDIAKQIAADAVARLGVGRGLHVKPDNPLAPALLAQALIEAFRDEKLAAKARGVVPDFARRLEPRPENVVADFVDELA